MRPIDHNFAANLRHYRMARGLSQAALARHMTQRGFPFSQATVWKIEVLCRLVKVGEAVALADALGLSADKLTDDPAKGTGLPGLNGRSGRIGAPVQSSSGTGQQRCLDCAAVLHTDDVTGGLVGGWGERIYPASYRPHVPDLPSVPVRTAGPSAPATNMTDLLRRTGPLAGAGAVPDPPPPHQAGCARSFPDGSAETRYAGNHLAVRLDPGDPAGPVPGALRAGATTAPARPQSGPATTGGAP